MEEKEDHGIDLIFSRWNRDRATERRIGLRAASFTVRVDHNLGSFDLVFQGGPSPIDLEEVAKYLQHQVESFADALKLAARTRLQIPGLPHPQNED